MTWDLPNIVVSVLFSLVGLAFLRFGKKQNEIRFAVLGVLLMGYSYFMPSLVWNILVGAALAAAPYTIWR